MTHEEMAEMYELYALGVLEPSERAEIDQHLGDKCPQCTQGVRAALEFTSLFAATAPDAQPPKRLRNRVLALTREQPNRFPRWIGGLAFASLALLTTSVVLWNQAQRRDRELAQTRSELRDRAADLGRLQAVIQFLNQPGTKAVDFQAAKPNGRVFANPRRGVLLIANNLPAPPPGKIFEMWFVPKSGAPIPAGLFHSDAQGHAFFVQEQKFDPANTAAVAVTIEPEAGSTTPTPPILFVAKLAD